MIEFIKASCLFIFGFIVTTEAIAAEAVDSLPETISVAEAVSYMNSDIGSASKRRKIAALAVNAKRLDLVDLCLADQLGMTNDLINELEQAPDSDFKDQIIIRVIRGKFGWGDPEWGSHGLPGIGELYSDIIERRLPGVVPEPSLLGSVAAREKLANDLEVAIGLQSGIPIQPKSDDVAFAATNSEAAPSLDPSAGSGQAIDTVNKTSWINYLWLAIVASGIVTVYMFVNKWKSSSKR